MSRRRRDRQLERPETGFTAAVNRLLAAVAGVKQTTVSAPTVDEAAGLLRVDRRTLWGMVMAGRLRHVTYRDVDGLLRLSSLAEVRRAMQQRPQGFLS